MTDRSVKADWSAKADWSRASLTETADAIAAGQTTARDVVEACLDRIGRLNGTLNCFVELDSTGARAAADAADAAQRQGKTLGPLHGVPMAHKDMYYRQGKVSACGSKRRGSRSCQSSSSSCARPWKRPTPRSISTPTRTTSASP